ncbi:MAG TPA: hypothetical protein VI033_06475 [Candidatus Nitrosopolaris sp.]
MSDPVFKKEVFLTSVMSLFPNEDILTKEIESWKGFADSLSSSEERELFMKMLNDCYKYAIATNAKGEPFPSEPLIMALLLSQHKMIDWLSVKLKNIMRQSNDRE